MDMTQAEYAKLSDAELLENYWAAFAEYGPFDISPQLHLKMIRIGAANRDDYERILESRIAFLELKCQ